MEELKNFNETRTSITASSIHKDDVRKSTVQVLTTRWNDYVDYMQREFPTVDVTNITDSKVLQESLINFIRPIYLEAVEDQKRYEAGTPERLSANIFAGSIAGYYVRAIRYNPNVSKDSVNRRLGNKLTLDSGAETVEG